MTRSTFSGVGTVLGGLPVYAFIDHGQDGFTGEYYSEIRSIHWLCKGDKPGKEIPQHIRDRAYKYDPYFSNLMDTVNDWTVYNRSGTNSVEAIAAPSCQVSACGT